MNRQLTPTVVVGLGKVGILAMFRVRGKVQAKAKASGFQPPIRFFGVDADPGVLRGIDGIDPSTTEVQELIVQCKFQPPGNYYKKWEDLKHLSAWLDSQFVFQIPQIGGTAGYRPLGRLAVFESHRRILGRLKAELETIGRDIELINKFARETGATFDFHPPRVIFVAGMGGGMGSGALLDLGYLSQKTLRETGVDNPAVECVLVAGIERDPKNVEMTKVNHFAIAQELLQYTQSDAELRVNYGDGAQHFTGPALTRTTLFDAMADALPDPKIEAICDAVGEMVWHSAASIVGNELAAATSTWPMFRGFGWFQLHYPASTLERRLALKMCAAVLDLWLKTLDQREADEVAAKAELKLSASGFDPKTLSDLVFQGANGNLNDLIFSIVGNHIKTLQSKLADPKVDPKEPLKIAVHQIREWLGTEATDSKDDPGDLKILWALRDGAKQTMAKVIDPLDVNVNRGMDELGPRLDRVRHALRGFSDYLVKQLDLQTANAKRELEQCGKQYKSIYDKIDSKLLAAVSAPAVMVNSVGQYFNSKIAQRLSENVANVYVTLRGRLSDRLKDMISARQKMDQLRDQIRRELAAPADYGAGYCSQPIFPGGLLGLDEALDGIAAKMLPARMIDVERIVQEKAVAPAGGMAQVVLADTGLEKGFGAKMVGAVQAWLHEQLGQGDVATSFLDRHAAEPDNANVELAAFVGWAAPTCPVRPAKPGVQEPPGVEIAVIAAPNSPAGDQCRASVETALAGVECRRLEDKFELIVCRASAHESFARILPTWVMDCSRPYRAACQGRSSPELFRDLSDR